VLGTGHAFLLLVPVPAVRASTFKVISVAEGEVEIPYGGHLNFSVPALVQVIAQAITVDLFAEFDNPVLIDEIIHVDVVRVVVGARSRKPVAGVQGLGHARQVIDNPIQLGGCDIAGLRLVNFQSFRTVPLATRDAKV